MCSISSSLDWILHSVGAKSTVQSPFNKHKQDEVLEGIASPEFEMCDLTPQEKAIQNHIEELQVEIDTEKSVSASLPPPKPLPKERLLGLGRRSCVGFI
jgi:hypothetical protein